MNWRHAPTLAAALLLLTACPSGDDLPDAAEVALVGEGFADLGPRYVGVADTADGRTDLPEDACHAWVQVLPAGASTADTQQYFVTFGLREPSDEDGDRGEDAPPVPVADVGCVRERETILAAVGARAGAPRTNFSVTLLDNEGRRWFVS